MSGKKMFCVLCFGHHAKILAQFWEPLLCLCQKAPGWPEVQCWQPWFREGAWLWLFEHPTSAVKTTATQCPQGKAEQMVLLSLPPATLKERHIFCSTCVAQGQNLQRWLPTEMNLSQALERSTEDSEVNFKAKCFKLFFFETTGAILLKLGVCRTLLKVKPLKLS